MDTIIGALLVGWILYTLTRKCCCCCQCQQTPEEPIENEEILLKVFINDYLKVKGKNMAVSLSIYQEVNGQISLVDRKGNPAQPEAGSVSFSSSDESVFIVEEDPSNESKFKIIAQGVGVAQLNFSADADLDEDEVRTIEGFAAVEVLPEEAVAFAEAVFEAPVDQEESTTTSTSESTTETTTEVSTTETSTTEETTEAGPGEEPIL